ncbi:DUF418 domain-containing protein [Actinosynnema sp. NPDC047251]|uniref:DUF418 domain-containing protein n=1 Tax=Saccharothrix espanaensis (strain ATCC 51144 / DSM 44229 / JCM 9112 / NBRC 15066 / NRRL 15764) TaxID=1179773 RepID=K0JQP4_SACES|nr:DUF418 domain-containing protein [Saccharothrix espanaensis]CCH29765.1 hypothetical protein BN6_24510 [Saccharothrix espanaensis DSM 44229]
MSGRITALDVLRGVAILGTLGTNIWIFTDPDGPGGFLTGASGAGEALLRMVSNGKFLALLSILFGIGLAVQHRSAVKRGQRWPGWYLWRSALLMVEGALHFVLIFEFDVLMFYALVSVVVAFVVGRGTRVVWGWAIGAAVVHLALVGLLTLGMVTGRASLAGGMAIDTSSWWAHVQSRLDHVVALRFEAVFVLPLSTVLFLAGAMLLRAGALEDSTRGHRIQRRLMGWGLGVGLPLNVLTTLAGGEWFAVDRYVCAPAVAFGLLGGITALVHRMRAEPGVLRRGVTAVGRSALSCYIGQNLIASVLCYRWGLDLTGRFGHLGVWFTVGMWVVVSGLLMLGATWWMGRFSRGPVETLWNWAYRAPQRRPTPVA